MSVADQAFTINITPVVVDGTVWLNGNGTWEDGATPGAPTFNALQAVVNSINATTGGWAQLNSTTAATQGWAGPAFETRLNQTGVLLTQAQAVAIQEAFSGAGTGGRMCPVQAPSAVLEVWSSGFWTGKSFIVGISGGHNTYNGIEMYRVRISDPPAAVRMYDPPAVTIDVGGSDWATDWAVDSASARGVQAFHQYDQMLWNPATQKGYAFFFSVRSFNPNAATPKSAWELVSPWVPALSGGFGSLVRMTSNELYLHATDQASFVINLTTGARRSLVAWPTDPFRPFTVSSYNWLARSGVALTDKVYTTIESNVTGSVRYHVITYNPATGANVWAPSAANVFPTWWPSNGLHNYRPMTTATGSFGERCVAYEGKPNDPTFVSGCAVWCYDAATNTMQEYSSLATPRPNGSIEATVGERFQYVPQVKAFVAILKVTENVWVFRPPAAWGIV